MKQIAAGALAGSALVYLGLEIAGVGSPLAAAVKAAAEAATIGALADWFAVEALFRRPLGLPIPHTALLPNKKDRIGVALGEFIRDHFVDPDAMAARLLSIDIPGRIAAWLERLACDTAIGQDFSAHIATLLDGLDDAAITATAKQELRHLIGGSGEAEAIRRALITSVAGHAKQRIVQDRQTITRTLHAQIRGLIPSLDIGPLTVNARRFAPKELTWLAADQVYLKLLEAFATAGDELMVRNSRLSRTVNATIDEVVAALTGSGDDLDAAFGAAWKTLRGRLAEIIAVSGPDLMRQNAAKLADRLRTDAAFRDWINGQIGDIVSAAVAEHKHLVSGHVAEIVKGWTPQAAADEIERYLGRDLQFIRLNGTIVGGLAGLAIHVLTLAIRGG
jgi:uncharacterized membrane-anchored protein YjiN (DUF445 family)